MDYKEKLKAIINSKKTPFVDINTILKYFPELKESEDERIRKELIEVIKDLVLPDEQQSRFVAWLEKKCEKKVEYIYPKFRIGDLIEPIKPNGYYKPVRITYIGDGSYTCCSDDNTSFVGLPISMEDEYKLVEQKPTDKIEPKFKVGDWIVDSQGLTHQIERVVENVTIHTFGYDIVGGGYFNDSVEGVRLWTIQDAKDGDVLYENDTESILIFKSQTCEWIKVYCDYWVSKDKFTGTDMADYGRLSEMKFAPATKEQRNLLFEKMKEAGYEWDADKKELKKNDARKNLTLDGDLMEADCMIVEQKPAWSEEDEETIDLTIAVLKENLPHGYFKTNPINTSNMGGIHTEELIKRLKSLKPQYHWKPTKEQLHTLNAAVEYTKTTEYKEILQSLYNDLKKL